MAEDKFDVYYSTGGDGGLYNLESEINNHVTIVSNLRKMKKLREKVIQEVEKGRKSTEKSRMNLFKELDPLISNWKGQYPDLGKLFGREEMDWLIKKYLKFVAKRATIKTNLLSFVIECGYKDKPDVDEGGKQLLRRTTPLHYARSRKFFCGNSTVRELFRIYDRFDVNYCDERGYTHFHIACASNCEDIVKKFLELGQEPNCLLQKSVDPPLYMALDYKHLSVAELLLENGANPNLTYKRGLTLLHLICSRECDDDLAEQFSQMCDDRNLPLQVDARDKSDDTPLHSAVRNNNKKAAKLLLKRGANPNLANKYGWTPLHLIFSRKCDDDLAELFFQMCDDSNPLQVDSRDKVDNTPLHLAVRNNNKKAVKLLLKRGANPNLANKYGWTPLHLIFSRKCDDDLAELFFQMCDDSNPLHVDALDQRGDTPLHLAVRNNNKKAAKLLLKRGADPNMANVYGATPLHVICMNKNDAADLAETLFDICDDRQQMVQVDAKGEYGLTPLQWAVANLHPNLVDILLDHGAKLSNFVFPTPSHLDVGFVTHLDEASVHTKLKVVLDVRAVVKRLEKKGYKLKLMDVQSITRLFDTYGLFEKLTDLNEHWYEKKEFAKKSKHLMVSPSVSLYNLLRLPPAKAEEILPNEDYYHKLVSSTQWSKLPEEFRIASVVQLCDIMARGFLYRRRALASLLKLTRNKLPIFCYDMIIEPLTNKDLWHICLASPR